MEILCKSFIIAFVSFFGTDVPVVGFYKWSSFKIYKNLLLGLLKSKYKKKSNCFPIARIPVIFFERQSLRSSFSSRMSFSSLTFFFRNVTKVRTPPPPRNKPTNPLPPNLVT